MQRSLRTHREIEGLRAIAPAETPEHLGHPIIRRALELQGANRTATTGYNRMTSRHPHPCMSNNHTPMCHNSRSNHESFAGD